MFAGVQPAYAQLRPRLSYTAPARCPDARWLESELRDQGVPEAVEGDIAVGVIEANGLAASRPSFVGSIRYGRQGVTVWERQLEAYSCGDLLSALAVGLGLHLDGGALDPGPAGSTASGSATVSSTGTTPPSTKERSRSETVPNRAEFGVTDPVGASTGAVLPAAADALPSPEPERPTASLAEAQDAVPPSVELPADGSSSLELPQPLTNDWRLGLGVGGALRTGLDPEPSAGVSGTLFLRGERAGWGSGPVGVGFTYVPSVESVHVESRSGERVRWRHSWWTTNVFVTPGTFSLPSGYRIGFVTGVHVGRYTPRSPFPDEAETIAFTELMLRAEGELGTWLVDSQLGLQLPIDGIAISPDNQVLHRQEAGLVVGLGASWLGGVL